MQITYDRMMSNTGKSGRKRETIMKCRIAIILLLTIVLSLSGCGCQHEWQDADCVTPKTCALCQQTEGDALGHSWQEASCETPKTCTACGATEGEALGHTWQEATCETPKTCTACGKTEGEASHGWTDWSFDGEAAMARSCGSCGAEESRSMEEYLQEHLAGHWDAVSVMNLNRRSEDDPYWENAEFYYAGAMPYMKILKDGSHEIFAGSVHYTDCRLKFISASHDVKIPPSEEIYDAYHFGLHPENGKGVWFLYVPQEDAVFLMGYIRFERETEEMTALRDQLAGTWVYDSEYLYNESDTTIDRSTYRVEFSREGTFRAELDKRIEGSWGYNNTLVSDGVTYQGLYVVFDGNYRNTNVVLEISEDGTRLRFDRIGTDRVYFVKE